MDWFEILITVPAGQTETAGAIANMTVPYGIYIEDYSDLEKGAREIAHIDLIDEALLAKNREESVIHIYLSPEANTAEALSFLQERLTAAACLLPYRPAACGRATGPTTGSSFSR